MSLLNFNFVMIYIIHKMLVTGIILKIIFLDAFLRGVIGFYFFKESIFFITCYDGKSKA